MPSWNIHAAHVQRILREEGAEALGIHDVNAFLVGNFVPDFYVGFMVPHASIRIDYKMTHLARGGSIPLPNYDLFWELYIENPYRPPTDLVLGAWAHLVADRVYNQHTRARFAQMGIEINDAAREGKQSDFAMFGATLPVTLEPHEDDALLQQCDRFPQYSIAERDVHEAVDVARDIVEGCGVGSQDEHPAYHLLDDAFFTAAYEETDETIRHGLLLRAERLSRG